ncbi:acyltransferase [Bradyrhizobium sp. B117]|uniref:acyltransferase family protein n=1 Tax=Bradyrhizobium sp. B117 TaxID=3140246 RepID=UPI003183BB82
MRKQEGIQAARAVAAIGILYFHSWVALVRFPEGRSFQIPIWTDYGGLAVDLFFAISGYVICLVVTKPQFSPVPFLIKRVFRLYPIWLITLTAFAALALLWRAPTVTETWGYFLYSATLLPTKDLPFYNVGWSLQHEMVFYLLAAVLVPLGGVQALAAFLVASSLAAYTVDMPWYLSSLALHHSEFLAGVLAYLLAPRLERFGVLAPLFVGVCLLWALMLFAGYIYIGPAMFFIVVAFANLRTVPQWAVALGDASYSIYLIHPIVFLVASAAASKLAARPLWLAEPLRAVSIGAIILLALASYRWLEKPTIRLGNIVAARSQARKQPQIA